MTTKKTAVAAAVRDPDPGPDGGPAVDGTRAGGVGVAAVSATAVDFVTFVLEGETYAFPMERVQEIIRMPRAVRVPLGPPGLEGLANLRGRVLPIVSLRSCCGLPAVEPDEATRVIVVEGGATLGFVVDRVARVTSVDAARVEPADRIGGSINSELVCGFFKLADGDDRLTTVLDVPRLIGSQFALLGEGSAPTGSRGVAVAVDGVGVSADSAEQAHDDTLELVSFVVDGQEYALPIDRVQEIVQAPERVTTVPNAEPGVLGVMDLRGRLLPVVSLRAVFGLASAPLEPKNRIVVVQLPDDGSGDAGVVGVVMDTVREVLRVPHTVVAELPDFMACAGRAREVEMICRLEQGSRLVSVLSVERMFAAEGLRSAMREACGEETGGVEGEDRLVAGDLTGRDERGGDGEDEVLVVFRLDAEEYTVGVDAVQEIIRVPETLIRVPKALEFVEGLVNLRGVVLPVVDLRARLGLARSDRDERQRIIVLLVNGVRTGFVVDTVSEVLRVTCGEVEPAPELSREQSRLVRRVANLASSQRMLLMLEPDHLLGDDRMSAVIPHQREAEAEGEVAAG